MKLAALLFASALSLFAGTVYSDGTASFVSNGVVAKDTRVVFDAPNTNFPGVNESSDCPGLLLQGCVLGTFQLDFSSFVIPAGNYVTNATLNLTIKIPIIDSGWSVTSITQIDPNGPAAGSAGYQGNDGPFSRLFSPANTVYAYPGLLGYMYVENTINVTALAQAGQLPSVLGDFVFNFGLAGGLTPAVSDNTSVTWERSFSLATGQVVGSSTYVVIDFDTPEPATWSLLALGLLGLGIIRRRDWARARH